MLELARSQSEVIRKAKDFSPVEKPSLCRVLKLALFGLPGYLLSLSQEAGCSPWEP